MQASALIVADTAGVIQFWSAGAEALFGYTAAETVGQSLDVIVPDEHRARHWEAFHTAMRTGRSKLDGAVHPALPVHCRDGVVRRFPGRFVFLLDPRGQAVGAMAIYTSPEA